MDQFKVESLPGNQEGIRILRLNGPFTLPGLFEFQSIFRGLTDPVTLIDLTDVPFMDSACLGALLSVHTTSQRNNRHYALVGACERLHTLFHVAGVDGVLVECSTLEEAERMFASKAASS